MKNYQVILSLLTALAVLLLFSIAVSNLVDQASETIKSRPASDSVIQKKYSPPASPEVQPCPPEKISPDGVCLDSK